MADSARLSPDTACQKSSDSANSLEDAKIAEAAKMAEATELRRVAETAEFLRAEKGTLYADASEALKEVRKDFYYWSTKLTEGSFALSIGVIAANWAVFGSLDKILSNRWSQFSIVSVILALGLNLIGYKRLIDALRNQIRYAEENRARWHTEFVESLNLRSDWPYTAKITNIAQFHRSCRMWLPLVGGLLFLVALFAASVPVSPSQPSPQSTPHPPLRSTPPQLSPLPSPQLPPIVN